MPAEFYLWLITPVAAALAWWHGHALGRARTDRELAHLLAAILHDQAKADALYVAEREHEALRAEGKLPPQGRLN